jgi:protoporphyrinogen oxidase
MGLNISQPSSKQRIAVIGAGIGGMSAAFDLVRAGRQVTIFEADSIPGGLAAGFKEPNWEWSVERYYHHWFATDRHILGLIGELGWSDQVLFPRPYTVMYHQGKFYPFDSILYALLFPGLGWGINKARFGLVGLFLRLTNNWRALESWTADAWMRKWAGQRVYQLMWEPLLIGKFGETYARQVNMAWMWARLKTRTTRLGTFQGGFQTFSDMFANQLRDLNVNFLFSTPIQSITPTVSGKLLLEFGDGAKEFDQVLVTTSPALLARLALDLPPNYLQGLLDLKSMGSVVMTLALKHPLSEQGYYWFNLPKSAGYPYLALVEHTNFLSPAYFGGEHIIYIGDYLDPGHEYFQLDQDELLQRFLPSLVRFNPRFQPDWVRKTWLYRTPYAQPIPFTNHSANIPSIQTPVPGLYFASMSQVYPWDRGTNFAVEIGRQAAELMLQCSGNWKV